ncbi:MAG: hypothetical protein ABJB11_21465 [Ferruginibacter sp.]
MFPVVHFKLSLAGGDTSQGSQPWAVSPPPTVLQIKRQFEIHPFPVVSNHLLDNTSAVGQKDTTAAFG